MIDLAKLDAIIAAVGDEGMQVSKADLVEFAEELRFGNAARLMLAAEMSVVGACAAIAGATA